MLLLLPSHNDIVHRWRICRRWRNIIIYYGWLRSWNGRKWETVWFVVAFCFVFTLLVETDASLDCIGFIDDRKINSSSSRVRETWKRSQRSLNSITRKRKPIRPKLRRIDSTKTCAILSHWLTSETDHVGSIYEGEEKYECAGRNAMKDFGNDILSAGIQRYQQVSTINKAKWDSRISTTRDSSAVSLRNLQWINNRRGWQTSWGLHGWQWNNDSKIVMLN